jgi:hypothetical protein
VTLAEAFAQQAGACRRLGSPFMGRLFDILAEDFPVGGPLADHFAGFHGDLGPAGHSLPLRLSGGLHALVLGHEDAGLVAVYPPHNPTRPALRRAVLAALEKHAAFLIDWTRGAPQTNEVRRSAVLIAGARVALKHFDLPVMLSELGASGGLNLMWDHYALEIGGHRFGPSMPTLILSPDWTGPLPSVRTPVIAERAGVDLKPLDLSRGDHLLRLTAFLWADQPERLVMTRAAASVAGGMVAKGDAIDWLAPRLHAAPQGQLHLIQHTVAWQYFPPATQARGRALIEAAGAQATPNRPLGWLSMETDGDTGGARGAAVTLRLWPGDITLALGRADFHGRWIDWQHEG